MKRCGFGLLLMLSVVGAAVPAAEDHADHAVVLLYHHVADDTPASTSVRPDRFAEHLDWLAVNGYRVLALDELLGRLKTGRAVPDRAVAITFDDAWVSVHDVAAPMLAERGWPFTVFVNTDAVDAGEGPVMNWDQLRALEARGGSLGSHSATHAHMPARRDGESKTDWRRRIDADLARAAARIEEKTGQVARAFAYPYGEDSAALAERVARVHEFALVQRSGAVGPGSDFLAVPRFPLAVGFDGLDRLERAVRARPLPVDEVRTDPHGDGVRDEPLARLTLVLDPDADRDGYRDGSTRCAGLLLVRGRCAGDRATDERDAARRSSHAGGSRPARPQQDQLHRTGRRRQRRLVLVRLSVAAPAAGVAAWNRLHWPHRSTTGVGHEVGARAAEPQRRGSSRAAGRGRRRTGAGRNRHRRGDRSAARQESDGAARADPAAGLAGARRAERAGESPGPGVAGLHRGHPGRDRGYLERTVRAARLALSGADTGPVQRRRPVGLRTRKQRHGSVLLSGRPPGLHRHVVFRPDGAPARRRGGISPRPTSSPTRSATMSRP